MNYDMHPEIKDFFEKEGHVIDKRDHKLFVVYTSNLRLGKQPLLLIRKNLNKKMYFIDPINEEFQTENEALRYIKLKAFL